MTKEIKDNAHITGGVRDFAILPLLPGRDLTQEEKRAKKYEELEQEDQEMKNAYAAYCEEKGITPDVTYILENFGIGVRDAYDDADIDAMIAKEEEAASIAKKGDA